MKKMSKLVAANSWQKNNITHKKTAENDKIVIKIKSNDNIVIKTKNKTDTCCKKRYGKIKQTLAAKRDIEK